MWVVRVSADGSHLDYSTLLGGSNTDFISRIAVDAAGYVTLAGTTNSNDYLTTPGAYQPNFGGGIVGTAGFNQRVAYDAFATRLTPDGTSLIYSTYPGGANDDEARGVAIDADGNAYVVGYHISEDTPPSEFDILVFCLDASGANLLFKVTEWSAVANDGHGIALGPDGSGTNISEALFLTLSHYLHYSFVHVNIIHLPARPAVLYTLKHWHVRLFAEVI
jgi:hypothetical protein